MKVAAIQHDVVWESPEENFKALAPLIADAAAQGAQFIALTEIFAWGFSTNTETVREPVGGLSTQFLSEQAEATGAYLCGSVPVVVDGEDLPRNRLIVVGPDGFIAHYDKMYPFSFAGEDEHYNSGDRPLTIKVEGLRISLFVCYDLRFSNEFWNLAESTDLYVVVANWPASRSLHWSTLLRARAIENQAWVLGVNRVGSDDNDLDYSGDSVLIDPLGEIVAAAPPGEVHTLVGKVSSKTVRQTREQFPFLQDRR